MTALALPGRFPICGRALHRHAAKVKRDGIDILAELHRAERYVEPILSRSLTTDQLCRFRESIRDALKHSARRHHENGKRPTTVNTYA